MSQVKPPATPSPSGWRTDEILIGGLQHAAGNALLLAAWVFILVCQERAAASALLPALLVLGLSVASQIRFRATFERAVTLVGAWTLVAPWALGFAANDAATWAHVTLGAVVVASAVTWLRIARTS